MLPDPVVDQMSTAIRHMEETAPPVSRILNLYPYYTEDGSDTYLKAGLTQCDSLSGDDQWTIAFNSHGRSTPWNLRGWYAHHHGNMILRYYKTFLELGEHDELEKASVQKLFLINQHMLETKRPKSVPLEFERLPMMYNVAMYNNLGLIQKHAAKTDELAAIQQPFSDHQASILEFMRAEKNIIQAVAVEFRVPDYVTRNLADYSQKFMPRTLPI